jgi:hypothetical protein
VSQPLTYFFTSVSSVGHQHCHPISSFILFNLRHAQAQNVIEHIFGVLKQRFQILILAPAYSIEIQSHIPAALAAVHNFIQSHNPLETTQLDHDNPDHAPGGFYAGDDSFIPGGCNIYIINVVVGILPHALH